MKSFGIAKPKLLIIIVSATLLIAIGYQQVAKNDKAIAKRAALDCYSQVEQMQRSDTHETLIGVCAKMREDYISRFGDDIPAPNPQAETLTVRDYHQEVAGTQPGGWKVVDSDNEGATRFNMNSYSREGDVVRVQVETTLTKPATLRNISGVVKTLEEDIFDCSTRKIAIVKDSWYSNSGELLHSRTNKDADIPNLSISIDLDKYSETLWRVACQDQSRTNNN